LKLPKSQIFVFVLQNDVLACVCSLPEGTLFYYHQKFSSGDGGQEQGHAFSGAAHAIMVLKLIEIGWQWIVRNWFV